MEKNIKVKTGLWNIHPFLSKNSAHALYPYIYIPQWLYEELKKKNPDPYAIASLMHEQVHIRRQKEIGFLKFGILYLISRKFRFEEELLAIREQMKYLKKMGKEFDIEQRAKQLSGSMYLWSSSYSEAKRRLRNLLD